MTKVTKDAMNYASTVVCCSLGKVIHLSGDTDVVFGHKILNPIHNKV